MDGFVAEIEPYVEAGFDEVALMEIGGDAQDDFIGWAEREPLPALRSL